MSASLIASSSLGYRAVDHPILSQEHAQGLKGRREAVRLLHAPRLLPNAQRPQAAIRWVVVQTSMVATDTEMGMVRRVASGTMYSMMLDMERKPEDSSQPIQAILNHRQNARIRCSCSEWCLHLP